MYSAGIMIHNSLLRASKYTRDGVAVKVCAVSYHNNGIGLRLL